MPTTSKANNILIRALVAIWAFFVIPDYIFNHPYYANLLGNFAYVEYIIFSALLFGGFLYWQSDKKLSLKQSFPLSIAGWQVVTGVLLGVVVLYVLFHGKMGMEGSALSGGLRLAAMGTIYTLGLAWIMISSFSVGQFALRRIKTHYDPASYQIISIAVGLGVIGTIVVLLGMVGFLNRWFLLGLTLAPVGIFHKEVGAFLQSLFLRPVKYTNVTLGKVSPLLVIFLLLPPAFMAAMKAFPVGFDGSGLYINLSTLIADYGALPQGGQPFSWSVIMSLGELMFGNVTVSLLLSHFTILLALVVVYRLSRLVMSAERAWLPTAMFHALPAITFQATYEEKTDFGLTFMVLAAFLLLIEPRVRKSESTPLMTWAWAGFLLGFAFGIKVLALYGIIAAGALWAYRQWGQYAFFGTLSLSACILFLAGLNEMAYLDLRPREVLFSELILGIAGLVCFTVAFIKNKGNALIPPKGEWVKIGVFTALVILPILPWGIKNVMEHGSVSMSNALAGKMPSPEVKTSLRHFADEADLHPLRDKRQNLIRQEVDSLQNREFQQPPAKKRNKQKKGISDSEREEIKRYIGYEKGFPLYFSVPYDATMGNNIPDRTYIDISFLFMLLLPLFFLRGNAKGLVPNIIFGIMVSTLIGLGWVAHYAPAGDYGTIAAGLEVTQQKWENFGAGGFANAWAGVVAGTLSFFQFIDEHLHKFLMGLGFPAMLLFVLAMTAFGQWLLRGKEKHLPKGMKEIFALFFATFALWYISANNIPWYGFPSLALGCVMLGFLVEKPDWIAGKENGKWLSWFVVGALGIFFFLGVALRYSSPEMPGKGSKGFVDKLFIQYAAAGKSKEALLTQLSPRYNDAISLLNQNPQDKIYRIGTYLNYHIAFNDRRVLEDNQLKVYGFYEKRLPDHSRFVDILKENGFRYILYDINTPSIDKTPEQSLAKKCDSFLRMLIDSPYAELMVTDRVVEASNPASTVVEPNAQFTKARYGLLGRQIRTGTFLLIELK